LCQRLNQSNHLTSPNLCLCKTYKGACQVILTTYPTLLVNRTKRHLLKDILVIAILSTIAGCDGRADMENYGISKQQWLQKFLDLPNGIPSDDTFRRVCEKLDPKILELKLAQGVKQLIGPACQQVIPIDGKSLRGSYDA